MPFYFEIHSLLLFVCALDWFLSAEYLLDELQLPRVNVSPTRHNGLAEVDVDVGDLVLVLEKG